jgi:transposase
VDAGVMESEASGAGRPTEYRDEFAEQALKLCHLGATDDELADFFNVHRATIYRWKHTVPEFCDAIKSGKEIADERVERSLYQKATGYNFTEQQAIKVKVEQHKEEVEVVDVERHSPADTTAAIFWLKNRRSAAWRDKQEHEHSGTVAADVTHHGSISVSATAAFIAEALGAGAETASREPGEE